MKMGLEIVYVMWTGFITEDGFICDGVSLEPNHAAFDRYAYIFLLLGYNRNGP